MRIAGIVLVVLGLIALVHRHFSYSTRDTVLDVGPLHAFADKKHKLNVPIYASVGAVVAGAVLIYVGRRERR